MFDAQQGLCIYCNSDLNLGYHSDHIFPLSEYLYNGPENIQLLCPSCNVKKQAADPIAYESKINFLTEDRRKFLNDLKQHIEQELAGHFNENVAA